MAPGRRTVLGGPGGYGGIRPGRPANRQGGHQVRRRGPQGGYLAIRAGLSTVQSAAWKINTGAWAKTWTPLFIPGGKAPSPAEAGFGAREARGTDVRILFADSRNSRGLAPNDQAPKEVEPWAVGEILLYEVTDPQKLLPPWPSLIL